MSKPPVDPLDNPALVRAMRDLCPKKGSGITSVTFTVAGCKPVKLTAESRRRANARLKTLQRQ